jgi:hypothetical protein
VTVDDSARRERSSRQETAGKTSDFPPLPCGVDRHPNPLLSGETPRLKRRYAIAAGVLAVGVASCVLWFLFAA